jgi:hypothetical protein
MLGWTPAFTVDAGLRETETVDWYRVYFQSAAGNPEPERARG